MDTAKKQHSTQQKKGRKRKPHHNGTPQPFNSTSAGAGYGLSGLCGSLAFCREKRTEIAVPEAMIKHKKSGYPSHLKLLKEQAQRLTNALKAIENQIEEFSKLYPESVKD